MHDPEDAIDEAYGSWLGSSGYADMKSYRDVFRDGWNAGREHEARNCPQEGRIVALKGEITDLQEQFDMYEASLHVEEETVKELRQVLAQEHTARVMLVNRLSELLPIIAGNGDPNADQCFVCDHDHGHAAECAYILALEAVAEAGRSVGI